jgi:hypothetical protein
VASSDAGTLERAHEVEQTAGIELPRSWAAALVLLANNITGTLSQRTGEAEQNIAGRVSYKNAIRARTQGNNSKLAATLRMATSHSITTMAEQSGPGNAGTGSGFGRLVLILAGVSSLVACLLTVLYVPIPFHIHHAHIYPRLTTLSPASSSCNARTTANPSSSAMSSASSCWCPSSVSLLGPV